MFMRIESIEKSLMIGHYEEASSKTDYSILLSVSKIQQSSLESMQHY